MTVMEVLCLRRISEAEFETRNAVGRGLQLDGSTLERPLDEPFDGLPPVRLTLVCDEHEGDGFVPREVVRIASRHGVCRLANGHAVLGLLAGVPLPPEQEPRLAGLFESLCLAKLSRSFFVDVAPLLSAATTATTTQQELELTLVVERGDLSAFSRACAPRAFWQALMSNGHRLAVSGSLRCRRLIVELPLVVATGTLPASVIAKLDVGDVVQLQTRRMKPDGTGSLSIGHQQVSYAFEAGQYRASITITAIHGSDRHAAKPLAESHSMNVSHEFDGFDDDDGDPPAGDQPSQEEAHADAASIAPVRSIAPQERSLIDVRDIDVQVAVEIGRLTVSISELEDLQIGSILKVSTPGDRRVTVKTLVSDDAGQSIAWGELVQVDDSLAVQITRVFE